MFEVCQSSEQLEMSNGVKFACFLDSQSVFDCSDMILCAVPVIPQTFFSNLSSLIFSTFFRTVAFASHKLFTKSTLEAGVFWDTVYLSQLKKHV